MRRFRYHPTLIPVKKITIFATTEETIEATSDMVDSVWDFPTGKYQSSCINSWKNNKKAIAQWAKHPIRLA